MMLFPHLFSSIDINGLTLKNRIVMTAMHLGYTPEGEVTDRLVAFYRARARGGVGLVIVGGCVIDEYGGMASMIGLSDDRFIPGLERLTRAVQSEGARIAAQLYEAGRYTRSSMIGGRKPFSASAVRSRLTGETPRALELDEIPGIQNSFAEAALRARKAGFDAVEILGSAGYLISQFLSPLTNLREDAYGGSPENRMRFGVEAVERVREAVGPDFPILMRLAGNDFMEGGNTNREAKRFASELEKAGVDLFNVTGGWHETRIPQLTAFVPRRAFVYLASGIKEAVSVPVIASNRINDPCIGEEIIRKGEADMVAMARALLADPDLPKKAAEGQVERIFHCIACNQGCFDRIFQLQPVECLVNPEAGREHELKVTPAMKPKKVLVLGGGPAGMKAACTAARRGHRVTLVEKRDRLGGQLLLNRSIPGRSELITVIEDLVNDMNALGVQVILNHEADEGWVKDMAPETVVLATGARPVIPAIPGIEGENVCRSWDVLEGKTAVGKKVVIIGGNAVGLETALYLANHGTIGPEVLHFLMVHRAEPLDTLETLLDRGNKDVTVLEMQKKAGTDIGDSTRWTVMAELRRLGVKVMTGAKALAVTSHGVEIEKQEGRALVPADSVVIAAGSIANQDLAGAVRRLVSEFYLIGDAKEPRNAMEAIREGYLTGLQV